MAVQRRVFGGCGLFLAGAAWLLSAGCGEPPAAPKKGGGTTGGSAKSEPAEEHHHHSHGEKGPHGGALVAIGDDAAHLEIVLDAETGKVTAYVLDGEAKSPLTIKAASLELTYSKEADHEHEEGDHDHDDDADELGETGTIVLTAVSPADDGACSEYAGESEALRGVDEFDAVLSAITIAGREYKKVEFNYPEGNEHDHHHH
ncbi:MAG: hypothetical protein ACKV0T_11370 [Planctomycetales bacterium]